jgi:DNA replication protein DnaC
MTETLGEILKNTVGDTPRDNLSQTQAVYQSDLPGDPQCPICQGVGYLREDVPLGHPDFGKVKPCQCLKRVIQARMQQRLYQFSHLERLKDKTFENFLPRGKIGLADAQADSLERAYHHALQYAHSLQGWLLIQGRYGCGKTHLAAAIANYIVGLGIPTLFITVPDLLDSLRYSYSDPDITFEEQFEQVRQVDLLVLDDFGTQNATPWAQESYFS